MCLMQKYSLVRVVLLLRAIASVETTNSCYSKDCYAAAAVFTSNNSNCFHFVIWHQFENK